MKLTCPDCHGTGYGGESVYGAEDCSRCGGSGELDVTLAGRDERPAHPFAREEYFVPEPRG